MLCPNGCEERIKFDLVEAHGIVCSSKFVDCPWKDVIGCGHRCGRSEMGAHSVDGSVHFMGMTKKISELTRKIKALETMTASLEEKSGTLEIENRQLIEHVSALQEEVGRRYTWNFPNFDINCPMQESPDFQAFGNIFYLSVLKKNDGIHHGLYLAMRSRVPDRIGFKLSIGQYDSDDSLFYAMTYVSDGLKDFCDSPHGFWAWGYGIIKTSDLENDKLLTPDGTLRVKVIVYKSMPNGL